MKIIKWILIIIGGLAFITAGAFIQKWVANL